MILVLGVCAALGAGFRWYCAFYVAHRTEHVLRSQLFAHLQQLHFGYHDRAQIGNLMARANLDLRQINQLVVFVPVFAANVVMVIAILAVLFTLNVKLTLLSLISFPLLAVGAAWFQRLLDPVAARLQERLAEVSEVVEEGVAGHPCRQGLRRRAGGEGAARRARRAGARAKRSRSGKLRATFNPMLDLLPMVALVTVLYVGGKDAIDGIAHRRRSRRVQRAPAAARLPAAHDVVRRRADRARVGVGGARAGGDGRRSRRSPTTSRCAADPAGARCGVVLGCVVRVPRRAATCCATSTSRSPAASRSRWSGPTGCGKSTVARLIPRFYDVAVGSVRIDGHDVRTCGSGRSGARSGSCSRRRSSSATRCGRTSRSPRVAARGDADHEPDRARRASSPVPTTSSATLPDGYDTLLGEHGFSLSGGQRQRLAIARAILADPRVLILDDATSAVDPTKEHEIRAALAEVMQGRTTLIIAHRPGDDRPRRSGRADGRRTAASPRPARTRTCSPRARSTARCSPRSPSTASRQPMSREPVAP